MPNPTNPYTYPQEFHDLITALNSNQPIKPIRVKCTTRASALAKRSYVSGFRSALKNYSTTAGTQAARDQYLAKHILSKRITTTLKQEDDLTWTLTISAKNSPEWIKAAMPETQVGTTLAKKPDRTLSPEDQAALDAEPSLADLAAHQIEQLRKVWSPKLIVQGILLHNLTDAEAIEAIAPHHKEAWDVNILPLIHGQPIGELGLPQSG